MILVVAFLLEALQSLYFMVQVFIFKTLYFVGITTRIKVKENRKQNDEENESLSFLQQVKERIYPFVL